MVSLEVRVQRETDESALSIRPTPAPRPRGMRVTRAAIRSRYICCSWIRTTCWNLGPWPVNPALVSTPAELIRAFEYLSLLRLGPDSRSWNHRAIAAHLGQTVPPDGRRAADELAALYEQARYAPADDPLPADALSTARRDLCLLAGVASRTAGGDKS